MNTNVTEEGILFERKCFYKYFTFMLKTYKKKISETLTCWSSSINECYFIFSSSYLLFKINTFKMLWKNFEYSLNTVHALLGHHYNSSLEATGIMNLLIFSQSSIDALTIYVFLKMYKYSHTLCIHLQLFSLLFLLLPGLSPPLLSSSSIFSSLSPPLLPPPSPSPSSSSQNYYYGSYLRLA